MQLKPYFSLITFSHTLFALPFALIGASWGMFTLHSRGIAPDKPYALSAVLVVLCMVFARSAAMAFNRYLDRDIDAQNARTRVREIPSGVISARNALVFTLVNAGLFVLATAFINPLCLALSPVALAVILGYSYTKRFTALCHLVLGLGLALAPVGAYLAVTGRFDWAPVVLGLAVLTWVSGFDIIYALQDEEFDRSHQLSSIPAWLGKARALAVSSGLHVLSAGLILGFGWLTGGRWGFAAGAAIFLCMLLYQHLLVSPGNLSRVNRAFFTANGIASVLFAACVIGELWVRA